MIIARLIDKFKLLISIIWGNQLFLLAQAGDNSKMRAVEYNPAQRLLLNIISPSHSTLDWGFMDKTLLDWQSVVSLAQQQDVASLFYDRLVQPEGNLVVTGEFLQALHNQYLAAARDNLRLFQQVGDILRALNEQSIKGVPLKGAYLAESVYHNIALRPMSDIDLLVQRRDLAPALAVMNKLGYRPPAPIDIARDCQVSHHLPGLRRPGDVTVELHWTLAPVNTPFRIDLEGLWQRAQPLELEGVGVLALAPEDLLLHLCLHTAYIDHFSSQLRPICDIVWTVRAFSDVMNWSALAQRAKAWGAQRTAWLALRVTQRLLAIELPSAFLDELRPVGYDPILEKWAIQQIFAPPPVTGKLAAVWAQKSLPGRIAQVGRSLFPPSWEVRSNNPALARGLGWPLAYLQHLGGVLQRNWRVVLRLAQSDRATQVASQQRHNINQLLDWQREKYTIQDKLVE